MAKRKKPVLSFSVSDGDRKLIRKIVKRHGLIAVQNGIQNMHSKKVLELLEMDLVACRANFHKLRLEDMVKSDDFNLWHDTTGILGKLQRDDNAFDYGRLKDCFLPRFAVSN